MNIDEVFGLILKRLACATNGVAYFGQDELDGFSVEAVDALKKQDILSKASDTKELICLGCEMKCNRPVRFSTVRGKPKKAFIVCNVPDAGDGEDDVPLSRLTRFQASELQLAQLVAKKCSLNEIPTNQNHVWTLGVYAGKKHSAILSLDFRSNCFFINDASFALLELITFNELALNVDTFKLTQATDMGLAPAGQAQNKALRKNKTQVRNEEWGKEYQRLKREKPNATDSWISKQIAKLPIADGKDSETIRKNMK